MKSIRSMAILAGLSLALFALGATAAKAQQARSLATTNFAGTINLPFDAQWGPMSLPAGEYSLYYGRISSGGADLVEVVGKEKGSPHGLILAQSPADATTTKNVLVCVREGNVGIVRALEMPAIGQSVHFALPHGTRLTADKSNHSGYTQLAEAPVLIQRIPVTMNAQ